MAELDYRQSGVDIDAGNEAVRRIKTLARGTYTPGVVSGMSAAASVASASLTARRNSRRHSSSTRSTIDKANGCLSRTKARSLRSRRGT